MRKAYKQKEKHGHITCKAVDAQVLEQHCQKQPWQVSYELKGQPN